MLRFFGQKIPLMLEFKLTKGNEKFYHGNTGNILNVIEREKLKGEFVLIIDNTKSK